MTIREAIDVGSSICVAVTAVALLGFYMHDRGREEGATYGEGYAEGWERWHEIAHHFGSSDGRVVVTAFMDFSCPYCRALAPVLDSLIDRFPTEVSYDFIHFPLPGRPDGEKYAVAAECAARQGRFREMYHALFSLIEPSGKHALAELAIEAGVADIQRFEECMTFPSDSFARIEAGLSLGESLHVRGTPTVWINGREFLGRDLAMFMKEVRRLGVSH